MKTTTSKKNIIMKNSILFATALLLAPCALFADVDWTAYAKSFNITFPGYKGATTLTDFPVLVRLSAARNKFDYSKCANGYDLRFSDAEGNLLSHEIDTWNNGGESLVWVKVPLFNADTVITAHYGRTGSGMPPEVTASDVWDSNYIGVWHLGQSSTPVDDSTSGGAALSASEEGISNLGFEAPGIVGYAIQFGLNDSISGRLLTSQSSCMLQGQSAFTIEYWSYQDAYDVGTKEREVVLMQELGRDPWKTAFRIYEPKSTSASKGKTVLQFNGAATYFSGNVNKPSRARWNYQVWRYNSSDGGALYLNGDRDCNLSAQGAVPTDASYSTLYFGNGVDNNLAYPGKMDEIRISTVVRSADWIKATYDCVTDEDFAEYTLAVGNDWGNYSHKFSVTFTGYTGNEALTDFPVLVKISENDIHGFLYADCLKPHGGDLRFADAEGNLLASEVDTWNPNGVSLVWVKVPSLTASTKISAYYGCESAPAVASSNVWANGYVGVWHMNETVLPLAESSGVSTPINNGHVRVAYGYPSILGNGVDMSDVTNAYQRGGWANQLYAANDSDLDGFTDFTLEMWTKQEAWGSDNNPILIAKRASGDFSYYWYCNKVGDERAAAMLICKDGSTTIYVNSNTGRPLLNEWTHQAFVRDTVANKCLAFVGGTNTWKNTSSSGTDKIWSGNAPVVFGSGVNGYPFPGQIDEARISRTSRSADWIKATSDCVTKANFATYSAAREVSRATVLIFN